MVTPAGETIAGEHGGFGEAVGLKVCHEGGDEGLAALDPFAGCQGGKELHHDSEKLIFVVPNSCQSWIHSKSVSQGFTVPESILDHPIFEWILRSIHRIRNGYCKFVTDPPDKTNLCASPTLSS